VYPDSRSGLPILVPPQGPEDFFTWCIGRAIIDFSPAKVVAAPARERSRERVLDDNELAGIIKTARQMNVPYGGIVEFLALTGQRREEVAQLTWDEIDLKNRIWTLPATRTKNAKTHIVHLSRGALAVLMRVPKLGKFVFSFTGTRPFSRFSAGKRMIDEVCGVSDRRLHDLRRTCVSGMARLGVAQNGLPKTMDCSTTEGVR
jgi:integrase